MTVSLFSHPKSILLKLLLLVVMLVVAASAFFALRDSISMAMLQEHRNALFAFREQNHLWALLLYSLFYIVMVVLLIPGTLVATLMGGFLFGFWIGGLVTLCAATMGASLVFFIIRLGFGESILARLDTGSPFVKKLSAAVVDNEWSVLFLIRLVPVLPFPVANVLSALLGASLYRYVISTFFGTAPWIMIYTFGGVGIGDVLADAHNPNLNLNLNIIFTPYILVPLLGVIALIVCRIFIKINKKSKKKTTINQ